MLLSVMIMSACGGGGSNTSSGSNNGDDNSGIVEGSPLPELIKVTPSQNSSIASSILHSFAIEFEFSDREGDLDNGKFCMDWELYSQCITFDESFTDFPRGSVQISFALFYTPPLVGDITVRCRLTDKAGNESNEKSFLFRQTEPSWPWQWGANGNDKGVDLAIGSDDRILVYGEYNQGRDPHVMFLAYYDPDAFCNGLLLFQINESIAVTIDAANNAYTLGTIYQDLPGYSGPDFLISKFDPDGELIWEDILSSTEDEIRGDIAVDRDSNVYVTGGTLGDLEGNINAGHYDMFLTKYDSSGNKLWTRQFGSPQTDYGTGVAVDSANYVYVVGGTHGDLDGVIHTGISDWNILAKYDSSGDKLWVRQFGEVHNYNTSDIVIDDVDNIYVVGENNGGLNKMGAAAGFVRKFNADGDLQWVQMMSGESWYAQCDAVSLDQDGNIVVTGGAYGDASSEIPTDGVDVFVAKYDSSGTQVWFTLISTPDSESGLAIAVDSNNDIYVTGATEGSFPGYSNIGHRDIFISKLDPNGIPVQNP